MNVADRAMMEYDALRRSGAPLSVRIEAATRVCELLRAERGEYSELRCMWVGILALDYTEAGDAGPALAAAERAVALAREVFPVGHPQTAKALNNLAYVLRRLERHDEAEANYRKALEIDREYYGDDHEETLTDERNLAICLQGRPNRTPEQGREITQLLGHVRQVNRETLFPDHPYVAEDLADEAGILLEDEDWAGAEAALRRAVAILDGLNSSSRLRDVSVLSQLAYVVGARGDVDEPVRLYRRVR